MKETARPKIGKDYICGLDIGAAKLCATCGRLGPSGKIDILASQTVPAQGVKAGRIIDGRKLSACVRDAIERLRKMCGFRIRRVYANIDSPDLRAKACEEKVLFEKKTRVKKIHIARLIDSCIFSKLPLNRKVIHTGFRNFILDNRISCIYPEGCKAHEVKLNIVIVSALIPAIKDFIKCIRDAGLILGDMVPSGCAQALAFFAGSAEKISEKNDILIDVGSALTKISLLKDKLLKDMAILPQGAQSITENIAVKLKLSFNCAEQLKIKYGRLLISENKFFTQKIIIKDKLINRVVQPRQLYEIIALKVEGLLQEIKRALLKLNYEDENIGQIVITGGGSILEGFLERAEQTLGKPVKMGFLSAVKDNRIQAQSALYATSIGLIHSGFKSRDKLNSFTGAKFDPFMRVFNQARGLYQEYF
ncbi:MAG: cell division protein FtsA [Candidatus Omnitrophica bacterium]|nr:cell division protein FtsA [Candidatus Omnitrophota bacterium]